MEHKLAIVIDAGGQKKEFVLVEVAEDGTETPQCYQMADNDRLIYEDISSALSMCKPVWTGGAWVETATAEELEATMPAPFEPQADPHDLALAELAEMVVTNQQQTDMALAEIVDILVGG